MEFPTWHEDGSGFLDVRLTGTTTVRRRLEAQALLDLTGDGWVVGAELADLAALGVSIRQPRCVSDRVEFRYSREYDRFRVARLGQTNPVDTMVHNIELELDDSGTLVALRLPVSRFQADATADEHNV